MTKLRIVSDGTSPGTHVETETGERIERVQAIEWKVEVRDIATVKLTLKRVPVDVVGVGRARFEPEDGTPT